MPLSSSYCSPEEIDRNGRCLLDHLERVPGYLRRKRFSDHAIEHAVTVVYCVAMPYITGAKICTISKRRAWVFKVAFNAAKFAAKRDVCRETVEPAILAAMLEDTEPGEELFAIRDVLKQLTKLQREAAELCILQEMSQRAAARKMGIAVSTLCGHLSAAKERLKKILSQFLPPYRSNPSARASNIVEREILGLLTSLPCSRTG